MQTETHPDTGSVSVQFKTANRELDPQRLDFRWIPDDAIQELTYPDDVVVLERMENGDFFGVLDRVDATGLDVPAVGSPIEQTCRPRWTPCGPARRAQSHPLPRRSGRSTTSCRTSRNRCCWRKYRRKKAVERDGADARRMLADYDAEIARQCIPRAGTQGAIGRTRDRATGHRSRTPRRPLRSSASRPADPRDRVGRHRASLAAQRHGILAKCRHYAAKIWELLWDDPRESNTEGGLFPAIFGTVMLVFLMADHVFPAGRAGRHLSGRIRQGRLAGATGADRREQPGRHPLDRLRHLRPGVLRVRRRRHCWTGGSIRSGSPPTRWSSAPAGCSGRA